MTSKLERLAEWFEVTEGHWTDDTGANFQTLAAAERYAKRKVQSGKWLYANVWAQLPSGIFHVTTYG